VIADDHEKERQKLLEQQKIQAELEVRVKEQERLLEQQRLQAVEKAKQVEREKLLAAAKAKLEAQ